MSVREQAAETIIAGVMAHTGGLVELAKLALAESDGSRAHALTLMSEALEESQLDKLTMARYISVLIVDRAAREMAG